LTLNSGIFFKNSFEISQKFHDKISGLKISFCISTYTYITVLDKQTAVVAPESLGIQTAFMSITSNRDNRN